MADTDQPVQGARLMAFEARYAGNCYDCEGRIELGDLIQFNDVGAVVHVPCPESPLDLKPSEQVCTECWLVKPCECEEQR